MKILIKSFLDSLHVTIKLSFLSFQSLHSTGNSCSFKYSSNTIADVYYLNMFKEEEYQFKGLQESRRYKNHRL